MISIVLSVLSEEFERPICSIVDVLSSTKKTLLPGNSLIFVRGISYIVLKNKEKIYSNKHYQQWKNGLRSKTNFKNSFSFFVALFIHSQRQFVDVIPSQKFLTSIFHFASSSFFNFEIMPSSNGSCLSKCSFFPTSTSSKARDVPPPHPVSTANISFEY